MPFFSSSHEGRVVSDDAGYESLRQHQQNLLGGQKQVMGLDSAQVQHQVYETLRKQSHLMAADPMVSSSGSSSSGGGQGAIKGIRPSLNLPSQHRPESPPELPPPPGDLSALYAKVDRSKKKKNRESDSSSSTASPCSPPPQLSPTKSLIQKFNTMGQSPQHQQHARLAHVQSNPLSSPAHSVGSPVEPMYATIGRNRGVARGINANNAV